MTTQPARAATSCAAALFALLLGAAADAADPPPASAYAELPPVAHAHLSADGSRIVMLRALQDTYQVVVLDVDGGDSRLLMAADPDQFLFNWCRWANDERIVCSIRSYATLRAGQIPGQMRRYRDGRTVFTRLLAINADGSEQLQLVPDAVTRPGQDLTWNPPDQDTIVSWLPEDPRHVLIQLQRDDRVHPTLYRLNIYNNRLERVRRHHPSVQRWYADDAGELRFAAGYRDGEPVAFAVRDGRLEELAIAGLTGVRPPQLLGFAPTGGAYVIANRGRDTRGLYRIDTTDGRVLETLHVDPDYDVDGTLLRSRDGRPLALAYARERPTLKWFDATLQARVTAVREAIPGRPSRVRVIDVDRARNRMLLATEGNGTLPSHYLYEHGNRQLVMIARAYPGLERAIESEAIRYPAADGLTVPAYLTLPPGHRDGPGPVVILPHGGPWARDAGGFDYWAQFLASRGYVVLQPNFRGSTGFGDRHLQAGFEQWGLAMQQDLLDGLDWLVEQGIADPGRVCFVGGSYGGYAALVAAFQTPQRLRCAVSFAGVTDLVELTRRWRQFRFGELAVARVQDGAARIANSPVHQVERVDAPLLIVHGDVDRSVMIEQSRELVAALEAAGKRVRYIEQPNGDHFLSLQSQRREFLEAMEDFLAAHLGG